MTEFKFVEVAATPYLYVEKSTSMKPDDIGAAMGSAFQEVWGFMEANKIPPAGGALSVYYEYDPEIMKFRAGFIVAPDALQKAAGNVMADKTPAGEALHFTHKGSYATLRDDYDAMMKHISEIGREVSAPTWEVYMNDPSQVAEEDLITEVYNTVK